MNINANDVSNINIESTIQKMDQQRFQNMSRYHSMNSPSRMSEDSFTLSNYAVEFKDLKGMLERETGIRKDEKAKSERTKDRDKKDKRDRRDRRGKYEADIEEDSEGLIDDWG